MDNFRNVAVEAIGYIADRIDLLEREKPVSINFKEISMHRRHFLSAFTTIELKLILMALILY